MSRKQWGHGYHRGVDDVKEGRKTDYKYVCKMSDHGHIISAYMVWGKTGDKLVLEDITYEVLTLFHLTGFVTHISEDEANILYENVSQVTEEELSEFNEPVFLINQKAFWGFVISDSKECDAEWKEAERMNLSIDEYYAKGLSHSKYNKVEKRT